MRLLFLSVLAWLAAYVFVCLQGASGADPLAFPLDEPPFAAQLASIDAEWNIHLRIGDRLRVVAAKDLAYWGRYREVDQGQKILLTDGSLIRADVLLLDNKQVVLGDATGLGRGQWDESILPREALSAIVYQPPAGAAAFDRFRASLWDDSLHADRLLLQGGESISGTLLAAPKSGRHAAEGVKPGAEVFLIARASVLEPLSIPAGKVIAFRNHMVVSGRSTAGGAWLGLADGSLLNARSIAVKGDEVAIALGAGGTLKTTLAGRDDPDKRFWDAVEFVQPAAARVEWLPHKKSLGYKHIPFLSVERELGIHQNVLGTRLRAGGATYLHGLGMPSTSRVAYEVAGYRKFAAELAIDDAAGRKGSVVFRVLLQGAVGNAVPGVPRTTDTPGSGKSDPTAWTTAYESPIIRGGDSPLPISLDLKGAQRMALIIDFADRGDECDWADWLNARLTE
jgi:hypothetical protein